MADRIHLTIDCAVPERLVPFWCAALRYVPEPPPAGHDTWRSYYLSIGEPEEELGDGDACDRVVDPDGEGSPIWFQVVPEPKTTKNRVHPDVQVTDRSDSWEVRRAALAARADELVALGGVLRRPIPHDPAAHLFCAVDDPEGNELCLV